MLACAPTAEKRLRQALEACGDITVKVTGHRADLVPAAGVDVLVVDMDSLGVAGLTLTAAAMRSTPLPVLALCPADGRRPTAAEAMQHGAVDAVSVAAALASEAR